MAKNNFNVTAVEVSSYAIKNFRNQMEGLSNATKDKIYIVEEDVINFESNCLFDVVIAYGLLHCLNNIAEVELVINKIKKLTKIGGLVVIVSFNNNIPVPDVQDYLEPTLLPQDYLLSQFLDWEILYYEDDVITETHPTSKVEHSHSLTRVLTQKIVQ